MTPQEERAEKVKAMLVGIVAILEDAGDYSDAQYCKTIGHLAQFVLLHHGLLETHNKSILGTMASMNTLIDGLRDQARKQNEVLAGLIAELAEHRRATGV